MSSFSEYVAENAEVLQAMPEAREYCKPVTMMAAAALVERDYGYSGYSLGIIQAWLSGALFEVVCSDGSRFRLFADRYGNVARVPEQVPA